MSLKVCAEPGCPTLTATTAAGRTKQTRCTKHTRARDKARGTRQERGYDAAYDRLRRAYQRRMDAGEVFVCWRCTELDKPHDVDPNDWHLGHSNADRSVIRGPQCPASNLATSISWDA